jgi:hypothetical protein
VDETGGLMRALKLAKERGKLGLKAPVQVWPDEQDALHALSGLISAHAAPSALNATLEQVLRATRPLHTSPLVSVLGEMREPVAAALPFELQLN